MEKINIGDFTDEMITNVISNLKYKSYAYNRQRSPEIPSWKWSLIYGIEAYLYEIMYEEESNKPK
jgi:hypothetical protein